jgi:hypothetical protein
MHRTQASASSRISPRRRRAMPIGFRSATRDPHLGKVSLFVLSALPSLLGCVSVHLVSIESL